MKTPKMNRELLEQCRLNAMGAEREARLLSQVEELERKNAKILQELIVYREGFEHFEGWCEQWNRGTLLRCSGSELYISARDLGVLLEIYDGLCKSLQEIGK